MESFHLMGAAFILIVLIMTLFITQPVALGGGLYYDTDFIHSFNTYLLSINHGPDSVLVIRDTTSLPEDTTPALMEFPV